MQVYDDLLKFSTHTECTVPGPEKNIEYLIDNNNYTCSALKVSMGLIRCNANSMREDVEAESSSLIEVDPYRRSRRSSDHNDVLSSIDFNTGRGSSGIDLRWHPKDYFVKLSKEKRMVS